MQDDITASVDVAACLHFCNDVPAPRGLPEARPAEIEEERDWAPPRAAIAAWLAWALGVALLGGDLIVNMGIESSVQCSTLACKWDRILVEAESGLAVSLWVFLFALFRRQWQLRAHESRALKTSEYVIVADGFRHCRCQHKSKQQHLCIYASSTMLGEAAEEFASKYGGEDLYALMDEATISLDRDRKRPL